VVYLRGGMEFAPDVRPLEAKSISVILYRILFIFSFAALLLMS